LTGVAIFFSEDRLLGSDKEVERAEWRIYPTKNYIWELKERKRDSSGEGRESQRGSGREPDVIFAPSKKAIRFLMLHTYTCPFAVTRSTVPSPPGSVDG
jgi:hypothetical protein